MPLYDIKCLECGHRMVDQFKLMDDPYPMCPECGGEMAFDWEGEAPAVWDFSKYEGLWEDLDVEPIEIRSRGQLREECHKRNLTSKLLEW